MRLAWFLVYAILTVSSLSQSLYKKGHLTANDIALGDELGMPNPVSYDPYTKQNFPKTYDKWGEEAISKINILRKKAALKATSSADCDNVEVSDLSNIRSTPKQSIVIFVDCSNGARLYFSEADLGDSNHNNAASEERKSLQLTNEEVIKYCHEKLRMSMKFPSSYNPSFWPPSIYRAKITGNIVVSIEFEAMNDFNSTLPQLGKCYFNSQGFNKIEISNR